MIVPLELASFGSFFDEHIVDAHRLPAFVYLIFFLGTFAFIRTSAHMIRAQVSWWPGNVEVGGTHIHHLVWGILLLMIAGWVGIVVAPEPPGREIVAAAFGIGTGLTLDEFALWLELRDVYWSAEGRKSIDAAVSVESELFALVGGAGGLGILLALVNCAKEKFGMALLGFVVPFVHVVGAIRLGKPHSLWAKLFYKDHQLARSEARFAGSRGEPFWKRGGELVSRFRLGRAGRSAQN